MVLFNSALDLQGHDSGMRIVSNVYATRERIADALDFPREKAGMALSLEYARLERDQIPWRAIPRAEAPVKEIVREGDGLDVNQLPIVRHFEMDLSPVITMGAVMKDPARALTAPSLPSVCAGPAPLITAPRITNTLQMNAAE